MSTRPVVGSVCFHRIPTSSSCMQMALGSVRTSPVESHSGTSK